jgi:hypothetical protein
MVQTQQTQPNRFTPSGRMKMGKDGKDIGEECTIDSMVGNDVYDAYIYCICMNGNDNKNNENDDNSD